MPFGSLLRVLPLAIAKTLTKVFGLATRTFFGRAPSRNDDKAGLIGVLSLVWVALLPALAFPGLAKAMLPLVPDDEVVLRGIVAALLVAGGPTVGLLIGRTANRHERGSRLALTAAEGYGYALITGVLVVALVLVVPVVKSSHLLRRLEMQHMAIMVTPERFDRVERHIVETLGGHGLEVAVGRENAVMRIIFHGLVWVEEHIFWRDMSNRISVIRGELDHGPLVVELHPTDLAVRARRTDASLVFAILAETLDDRDVYFTWDDDAQDLEERIRSAREAAGRGDPPNDESIAGMVAELRNLGLGPEQWSALRRQLHRLEADALRARLGEVAVGTTAGRDDAER